MVDFNLNIYKLYYLVLKKILNKIKYYLIMLNLIINKCKKIKLYFVYTKEYKFPVEIIGMENLINLIILCKYQTINQHTIKTINYYKLCISITYRNGLKLSCKIPY